MNPEITIDEREGLPSASFTPIGAKCNGAWHFIRGLPEEKKDTTTSDGTAIHEALETGSDDGLTTIDQMEITERIRRVESPELDAFFGSEPISLQNREKRLWLYRAGSKAFSAKLDMFAVSDNRAFAVNYKTGFAEMEPVERSAQIRSEAACLLSNFPKVTELKIGYIASRLSTKLEFVHMTDIKPKQFVNEWWNDTIAKWSPDSPRVAGKHCRWCKGKSRCEFGIAFAASATAILDPRPVDENGAQVEITKDEITKRVSEMNLAQAVDLYSQKSVVGAIIDAVKQRLLGLDAETLKTFGLMKARGRKETEITSAHLFMDWVTLTGEFQKSELDTAVTVSLSKLTDLRVKKTGETKKAASTGLKAALAHIIETSHQADTIAPYREPKPKLQEKS